MIMILDVDVTAEGDIIKLIAHRAIHHPQRRRRCRPLSEANITFLHNPRRSRAPFF